MAFLAAAGLITAAEVAAVTYFAQAVVVAYGINQAQAQRRRAKDAYNASLRDRKVTIRSSEAPRATAYGTTPISGPIAYLGTSGTTSERLHVVIALTGHEVDSIIDVLFDGVSLGALDGSGYVASGKYFKSRTHTKTEWFVNAPSAQGTVTLAYQSTEVLAVVFRTPDEAQNEVHLEFGVHYTIESGGGVIRFLGASQRFQSVAITYRHVTGGSLVQVKKFLGIALGQRDTELETLTAGTADPWLFTDVGAHVSRIRVSIEYDAEVITSMPNISVVMRGKKVYDPRSTLTAWSDNAALCCADFLRSSLGFGVDSARIDYVSLIQEANVCDEAVVIDGVGFTQKRYTADGALFTDAGNRDNLEALLTSCVGTAVYSGKWKILPADYRPYVADLGDDDLATGEIVTRVSAPYVDLFNSVRGQFVDAANKFATNDFPPYRSATYKAIDNNEEIWKDLDFPFCQDAIRAQRMAKLMMHRSRQAIVDSATYKARAIKLQPGDVVRVTRAWDGWVNKEFIVVSREFDPAKMHVRLTMREEAAAAYSENFAEWITPDPAPNTNLPDPSFVSPIEGAVILSSSSTYDIASDGTIEPYAILTWDAVTSSDVLRGGYIEVLWRFSTETEFRRIKVQADATSAKLGPVYPGKVIIADVIAVNGLLVRSQSTNLPPHAVGDVPQSGRPSVGGNLIQGAGFPFGTGEWRALSVYPWADRIKNGTDAFHKHPTLAFPGVPSNGIIDLVALSDNSDQIDCFALSPVVLLRRDKNYYFSGRVMPGFCVVRIGIIPIGADGGQGNGFLKYSEYAFAKTTTDHADINQYELLYDLVTAETVNSVANSNGVDLLPVRFMFLAKISKIAGYAGASIAGLTEPMICETAMKSLVPGTIIPWSDGPEAITLPDGVSPGMVSGNFEFELNQPLPHVITDALGPLSDFWVTPGSEKSRLVLTITGIVELEQVGTLHGVVTIQTSINHAQYPGGTFGVTTRTVADIHGFAAGEKREIPFVVRTTFDNPPATAGQIWVTIKRRNTVATIKEFKVTAEVIK